MPDVSRSITRTLRTFGAAWLVLTVFVLMLSPIGLARPRVASAQSNVPAPPTIVGEMAAVFDANTGELLYGKNEHQRNAMASTTKMMVGIIAAEKLPLDTIVTVAPEDLIGEASMGLQAGEKISVNDLLYGLMMASGNDAAMALAREAGSREPDPGNVKPVDRFVALMNQKVQDLGLKDTHYANPHGLDTPDHYSSAYDLGVITRDAMSKPILAKIAAMKEAKVGQRDIVNVNKLLGAYEGADGFKTGLTDNAGYCLAGTATRGDKKVISVVLKSNIENWVKDSGLLLDYGFTLLSLPTPTPSPAPTEIPTPIPAVGGVEETPSPASDSTPSGTPRTGAQQPQSWTSWLLIIVGAVGVGFLGLQARRFLLIHIELPRPRRRQRASSRDIQEMDLLDADDEEIDFSVDKFRKTEEPSAAPTSTDPKQGPRYLVRQVPPARESAKWHRWSVRPDERPAETPPPDQPERRQDRRQTAAPSIFKRDIEEPPESRPVAEPKQAPAAQPRKSVTPTMDTAARAISLAVEKRYDEAKTEFCKVIRSDPSFDFPAIPSFRRMDATAYAAMILSYHQCGYPVHARALLTVALLRYPENYHLLLAGDVLARDKAENPPS